MSYGRLAEHTLNHVITDEQVVALSAVLRAMGGPSLRGDARELRAKIIRELAASTEHPGFHSKRVYTLQEFADEFTLSKASVRNLLSASELVATYLLPGKPVITAEEAERWLMSRPTG